MADLAARTPAGDLLPLTEGATTLEEVAVGPITSVAPVRGREADVARALGVALPPPGMSVALGDGRLLWSGYTQMLAVGVPVMAAGAALTDQSDAWAVLRLKGAERADVLARLCPVDTRAAAFPDGAVVRTLLGHAAAILLARGGAVDIFVFRSMAATAIDDLRRAMANVAARAG